MSYTANDIETLSFRDAVRSRVEMYMGSADNQGVLQCAREIITNSIDEYTMGYGKTIKIDLWPNNKLVVEDEGRGCPFGKREDGTEALEAIYMFPHSGGKFNDKTYQNVAGLNGIGANGVALSSSYFKVISMRDNQRATMVLNDGVKISFDLNKEMPDYCHGTIVEFIPSPEVYRLEEIHFDWDEIINMCQTWSFLNRGLKFILHNHIQEDVREFCSNNGIVDLIASVAKNPIHATPINHCLKDGVNEIEIAIQWTKDKEKSFVFTNGLENTEGGTSLTGMKMAITRFMKKQFSDEFDGDMARTGLVYAVSCKIPHPSFANQTKTKVNNQELNGLAQKVTTEALTAFSQTNEFKEVVNFLSRERKAELAAQRARDAVINHQKQMATDMKKKVLMVDKLSDAQHLGETATLLICEGDSAKGALIQGRDVDNFGILPVRGKCINAMANPLEDVLENEEVKSILKALGIIAGQTYNPKKLRYGRVGICVDADRLKILRKF